MKKGFTLIELLVVISIISFLTVIILVNVNSARIKARNAAQIAQMEEYVNAFNIAYTTNPYPTTSGSCLGTYPGGVCAYIGSSGQLTTDMGLVNYLAPFIPSVPGNTLTYNLSGYLWTGYEYKCSVITNGICTQIQLLYPLEGVNVSCGLNAVSAIASPNTLCTITINTN